MKILVGLLLSIVITSCSSTPNKMAGQTSQTRKLASEDSDNTTRIGFIRSAECRTRTGEGFAEIQVREDDVIKSYWYKVNSKKICSEKVPSSTSITGTAPVLVDIVGSDSIGLGATLRMSTVTIENGFVTGIKTGELVKNKEFYDGTSDEDHEHINKGPVQKWFFDPKK